VLADSAPSQALNPAAGVKVTEVLQSIPILEPKLQLKLQPAPER